MVSNTDDSAVIGGSEAPSELSSGHEHVTHHEGLSPRDVRGRDRGHSPPSGNEGAGSLDEHGDAGLEKHWGEPPVRGPRGEYQPPLGPQFTSVEYRETSDGPIPPPTMLRAYGDLDPSFPERIMRMAEKDQDSRIECMERLTGAEVLAVKVGAVVASVTVLASLVAALVLTVMGFTNVGFILVLPAILTGVARLVSALRSRESSTDE